KSTSLGSKAETAVTRTILLPQVTSTEPSACFARRPVSMVMVLSPTLPVTVCLFIFYLLSQAEVVDEFHVRRVVGTLEVRQKFAAAVHHFHQTALRMNVVF